MRKAIAFFLFFSFAVSAQALKKPDEILYERFARAAYNFDFNASQKLADSLISEFPASPLGFHAYSMLQTWFYLGSRNEGVLKTFFIYSDSVLARFDNLQNYDENPYYLFRAGEEYSYRAIMFAFDFNKLSALWATKKAVSYFDDALDADENFYDAYAGPAVFGYFASFAPSFLKTGFSLLGIKTDVESNIDAFKKTFAKGDIAKPEAAFQLSKIYSDYYFDIDSSNFYLQWLRKRFPGNMFFAYQFAVNEIRAKRWANAEKTLRRIAEYDNPDFVQVKAFAFFLLGEINFYLNDFEKATKYFGKYFQNTRSINFLGYANYRAGLAYYFAGDKAKARESFLMAQYGNDDNYKDKFARERSMKILETDFASIDTNLIYAENFLRAGNYEKAYLRAKKIKRDDARSLTVFAEAAMKLGKFGEAEKALENLKRKLDDEGDDYYRFLYLNALLRYERGNYDAAKKNLDQLFDEANLNNELFAKARNLARKLKRF